MTASLAIELSAAESQALATAQTVVKSAVDRAKSVVSVNAEYLSTEHLKAAKGALSRLEGVAEAFSTIKLDTNRLVVVPCMYDSAIECPDIDCSHHGPAISKEMKAILTKSNRILKSEEEGEERYVLGIVLEPLKEMGKADSQDDTYSAEEVRKAAYLFMEEYANIGQQHQKYINGRVKIRENWITRDDSVIGGQFVAKGTWLLGVHVVDDDLWAKVKAGEFTGFSIGGWATANPV